MNYQKKLSGPIMDRIDLHLNVPSVDVNKLMVTDKESSKSEGSMLVRERVTRARKIQTERFKEIPHVHCNADMKNVHLKKFSNLTPSANVLLKQAVNKFNLSARTYFRLIKVSRTIADLSGSVDIEDKHVAEALMYRVRTGE